MGRKIALIGGGVLGSQIAFQTAYCGFDVTMWLRSESSIERAKPKIDKVKESYINAINQMADGTGPWCLGIADEGQLNKEECLAKVNKAYENIKYELDMKAAFSDAYLIIECLTENEQDKIDTFKKIAPLLDPNTILASNSSTLLPSTFAKYTGRPDKFLALHFANSIWKNNTAEVMAQPQTSKESFDKVVEFANDIRMLALPILKEKSGYLLNSLLVPFLLSGLDLFVNGVSDAKSIDLAWTRGTGAPKGPFQIIDTVGLATAYEIVLQYQKVPGLISPLLKKMLLPYNYKGMAEVLKKYMDDGKMGEASGEGFYKY